MRISHVGGGINLFISIQEICLPYKQTKHTLHIFWGDVKVGVEVKMKEVLIIVRLTQGVEVCQRGTEHHAKVKQFILPMCRFLIFF